MKTVFTSVMISLMLFTKGDAPQYKKNIKSVSNKSLNECKYFFLKHTELWGLSGIILYCFVLSTFVFS